MAQPSGLVAQAWRAVVLGVLAVVLSGCLSVKLVSDYDDQIDTGLTQMYGETTAFVDKMIAAQGTPAGSYDQNKDFYTGEQARLDALIVRAEAHRALNSCPSTEAVRKALQIAAPRSPAVNSALAHIPTGDCEVTLLQLTRGAYDDMAVFHRSQAGGIPAVARPILLDGGVGALLRAGITIEVAKKAVQSGETK